MPKIWDREGEALAVTGNTPFLLSDPEALWIVAEGKIDIFSVRVTDGQPVGYRRFLWTAEEDAGLLGVAEADGEGYGLLAVGAGPAVLRKIPLDRVFALSRSPAARQELAVPFRRFVKGASTACAARYEPQVHVLLGAGETDEVARGKNAGPRDRTVWVRVESGTVRFAGEENLLIAPEDGYIALGKGLFLQSAMDGTKLSTLDTESYLAADAKGDGIRRSFRNHFMRWVAQTNSEIEAVEAQRLAMKADAEKKMREEAIVGLISLLEPHVAEAAIPADGFPLLTACRMIGRVQTIDFRSPPKWELEGRLTDPLAAIGRISRVRYRQIAFRADWWNYDVGPLLGYRASTKAPVAILPDTAAGKGYFVHDPVDGSKTALTAEVAATLEPFGHCFYRPFPERALQWIDLARFAALDMKADLATVALMSILGAALGLLMPIANGKVFSAVIPTADPRQLWGVFAALVVAGLSSAMFELTKAFALVRSEGRANSSLQAGVIDRLFSLPVPFFRKYAVGDLVQRSMAINAVRAQLSGAAITSVLSGVTSLFNFALLFYYSWQLAGVAIGLLLLTILAMAVSSMKIVKIEREKTDVEAKISGLLFQMIGGVAKLRVAGAEGRAFAVWGKLFKREKELQYRAGRVQNFTEVYADLMPIVSSLLLFGIAGYLMQGKDPLKLDTGSFIAFNSAFGSFIASGCSLANTAVGLLNLLPTMEMAKPILEALPESDLSKPDPGQLTGRIEASHLSFRYAADGPLILNDVSFVAEPGEFLAFVGPSGSGKSTTLRMLLGFEAPETGAVYYDGQDLGTLDVGGVRRQIGVVLQTSKLIAGSVFQNIVGSAPLSMDDAMEAAEMAGFAGDIKSMPMGMHTMVSEGGSTLSGGQRQRLLIARALVKKPRIIFFDEATSALDNRTQEIVTQSLNKMFATRIVIAHRLSTVKNANRIYVIEAGRCVQSGSFDELYNVPGTFRDLASRQMA